MFCLEKMQAHFSKGNHLSLAVITASFSFVQFRSKSAPTVVWVALSWGLPRSTSLISQAVSSLWHFQEYLRIAQRTLARFSAVIFSDPLAYGFTKHEHYKQIAACESMDFPHGRSRAISRQPQQIIIF